jgi:hypothetical protein
MERGADGAMTGYCFPDMLVDVVRLSAAGERDRAHDLFDAHLPLIRYEQQAGVGLAVRKHVMMRRGVLASDAQRTPGSALSASARAEVECLLSRIARVDARASSEAAHARRRECHPAPAVVGRAMGEGRRSELGLVVDRDPARFTAGGRIHPDILDAYWRCGLRLFEGVPRPEGLADIEADLRDTLGRLPAERGSPVDAKGRPAVGADNQAPALFWSKPLGDPFGGTALANGRHPARMFERTPNRDTPREAVGLTSARSSPSRRPCAPWPLAAPGCHWGGERRWRRALPRGAVHRRAARPAPATGGHLASPRRLRGSPDQPLYLCHSVVDPLGPLAAKVHHKAVHPDLGILLHGVDRH